MIGMKHSIAVAAAAMALVAANPGESRAEFPEKPVEMTILFGSTAQTIGQLLSDQMSNHLPQRVIPVMRPGGGGSVGYQHVHSSEADGYSIVWNSNSISTAYHSGGIDFDYTAFRPIAKISVEVTAVAVSTASGWETLTDMVEAIQERGRPLLVGASGAGSFTHLVTEAVLDSIGLSDNSVHVPYDEGRAPVELLAGRIDAAVQWPGQFLSHHQAGTLRILCVTSAERLSSLPDVPTCIESGAPGVDMAMWRGLAAPADTPDDAIAKLEEAARLAVESEAFQSAAQTIGFEPDFVGAEEFGELIARDDETLSELMRNLGLAN